MFLIAALAMTGTGSVAFLLGGRLVEFMVSSTIAAISTYVLRRGVRENFWEDQI